MQKRNKKMKRVICSMMLALCFAFAANAQTPQPPLPGEGATTNAQQHNKQFAVKGAPLAPATLLLLGLAGGFAGVKVYRNNKKKGGTFEFRPLLKRILLIVAYFTINLCVCIEVPSITLM